MFSTGIGFTFYFQFNLTLDDEAKKYFVIADNLWVDKR